MVSTPAHSNTLIHSNSRPIPCALRYDFGLTLGWHRVILIDEHEDRDALIVLNARSLHVLFRPHPAALYAPWWTAKGKELVRKATILAQDAVALFDNFPKALRVDLRSPIRS